MTKNMMSQDQLDILRQGAFLPRCQAHQSGFKRFGNANLGEVADALFHSSLRVLAVFPGPDAHTIRNSSKIDKQFFCVFPARLAVARADIRVLDGVVRDEWHPVQTVYLGALYGVNHGFVLFCHGSGCLRVLVAQDAPVHIRAQVFAADLPCCEIFNSQAMFCWNTPVARRPKVNGLVRNTDVLGQLLNATGQLDGGMYVFHSSILHM